MEIWCNSALRCERAGHSAGWLDVFHEGEEAFGECGVNVDGAFEQSVRLIREHERAENLDEFAAFGGEDGSTKDAVVGGGDDGLHETSGFAPLDGPGDVAHRTSADLQLETFGPSFSLSDADTPAFQL